MYTEKHSFRTSKTQKQILNEMKFYKVNVSKFIREAVQEKLEREKKDILDNFKESQKEYCPF